VGELGQRGRPSPRRCDAVLDQGAVDGVGLGGDLEPGGGALAAGADGDVVLEHVLEQPRPGLSARGLVWLAAGALGAYVTLHVDFA